jgi:hypothetical protein
MQASFNQSELRPIVLPSVHNSSNNKLDVQRQKKSEWFLGRKSARRAPGATGRRLTNRPPDEITNLTVQDFYRSALYPRLLAATNIPPDEFLESLRLLKDCPFLVKSRRACHPLQAIVDEPIPKSSTPFSFVPVSDGCSIAQAALWHQS